MFSYTSIIIEKWNIYKILHEIIFTGKNILIRCLMLKLKFSIPNYSKHCFILKMEKSDY